MHHGDGNNRLRMGSAVMALAGLGFIGYAVIFFVRNFTNSFLELGIGHNEVSVGKDEIKAFSPSLYEYIGHLHIAISGFIAATGLAVVALAWFRCSATSSGRGSRLSPCRSSPWQSPCPLSE